MRYKRNTALDFDRGMLIIAMILLHCIDELYPFSFIGRSLRYVSGSFIMVAGFVISNIYLNKYNIHERKVYKRLLVRGLKLFLIFSALNVLMKLVLHQSYDGRGLAFYDFIENLLPIYLSGARELVSFDMLLPIAYLLIASGLLLSISSSRFKLTAIVTAFLLFIFCTIVYFKGPISYNFRFLTIGLFGVALGFIPTDRLDYYLMKYNAIVIIAYVVHLVVVKISMDYYLYYPVYAINVLINLVLLYWLGLKLNADNIFVKSVNILGQYSLLAYIAHIGAIAVLRVVIYNILKYGTSSVSVSAIFLFTIAIMILLIKIVDFYRGKNNSFEKIYRYIFA